MTKAAERQQDAALAALLATLSTERLEGILQALGITLPEDTTERRDPRRCRVCGLGYVACRRMAEKGDDDHAWTPDRDRTGRPTP